MSANLPLRDVQVPPAPSWWPPAPGYLMIGGVMLLLLAVAAFFWWQRRRRRQRWLQLFDQELASTADAAAELAAIAGLLRRAARQAQPGSESLRDDAWWQRVDPQGTLPEARRSLLAEGAYRPRVDVNEVAAVRRWARERYLAMLLERRR
ncbi:MULTISPECIES: DUF4381 family protein [Stenotrophomonas]|jgi:hypothetical protein|uniref:DUF4381 family protein n=1 Tax=Stenotrophomonas TaxID=40323 RepID=UPI00066C9869|nr:MULTISPECIES: DUF4381 family protein [Stenotrophomonas]MBA0352350.1 DUF4381 family protein [Stenotrophomonas maltophilia]MBH1695299.1 DUF4381 family protein [Stenotrophomonas maltophilia]MBH1817516.1 DUF4381 family protein [Stenotrophomonas maltophilia]MCU1032080.1 DUF4381 family protein [Stenotrophomonas maltophilia]MDH0550832.1 DUF4381 family protein [Stenotrophomonas sp. GD04006]